MQRLLLDEAGAGELHWSDFDHVAGDRDHLERILSGALRSERRGVNVLVHGPPGTGKTEFCKPWRRGENPGRNTEARLLA